MAWSLTLKKKQTEKKAKVVAAVWGTEFIQFPAALQIWHQNDLKKGMNRRTDTWQNGCFSKMDDDLVNITQNHHPLKVDVLPKMFLQIILAANS